MTIRIWIARTETLTEMVCEQVWRNLTWDEWHRFVGTDLPYERRENGRTWPSPMPSSSLRFTCSPVMNLIANWDPAILTNNGATISWIV